MTLWRYGLAADRMKRRSPMLARLKGDQLLAWRGLSVVGEATHSGGFCCQNDRAS